jgi:hypothetical protein
LNPKASIFSERVIKKKINHTVPIHDRGILQLIIKV